MGANKRKLLAITWGDEEATTYGALSTRVLVRARRPRVLLPTRIVVQGAIILRRGPGLRSHLCGLQGALEGCSNIYVPVQKCNRHPQLAGTHFSAGTALFPLGRLGPNPPAECQPSQEWTFKTFTTKVAVHSVLAGEMTGDR